MAYLTFQKKYVIIKKNTFLPIGFTQIDRPYEDSRSALPGGVALRDILGHMIGLLSTEKFSIWGLPTGNSVRPSPGRPVHLA